MRDHNIYHGSSGWADAFRQLDSRIVPQRDSLKHDAFLYFDLAWCLTTKLQSPAFAQAVLNGSGQFSSDDALRDISDGAAYKRILQLIPKERIPLGVALFHDRFKPKAFALVAVIVNLPKGSTLSYLWLCVF